MGQCKSLSSIKYYDNHVIVKCPLCKEIIKVPDLTGRFYIISETEYKCNICNTIFPITKFYK
jgi:hypothetical protein